MPEVMVLPGPDAVNEAGKRTASFQRPSPASFSRGKYPFGTTPIHGGYGKRSLSAGVVPITGRRNHVVLVDDAFLILQWRPISTSSIITDSSTGPASHGHIVGKDRTPHRPAADDSSVRDDGIHAVPCAGSSGRAG